MQMVIWNRFVTFGLQHCLQIVGYTFYDMSLLYQSRYSKLHKSIYGLSSDLYVLDFLSSLCSIYLYLNYQLSSLVLIQYSLRFPVYFQIPSFVDGNATSSIPISHAIFILQVIRCYLSFKVLKNIYNYRKTKNVHQCFSKFCKTIISIVVVFHISTYACSTVYLSSRRDNPISGKRKNYNMGKFGFFYIDHLNFVWILQNFILEPFKLLPQVFLNFVGSCTQGLSSRYVVYQFIANITITIALFHNLFQDLFYEKWYTIPFNYQSLFTSGMGLVLISVILYQSQFLYSNSSPRLMKYSDHLRTV